MKKRLKNGAQLITIKASKKQKQEHEVLIKKAQGNTLPCGKTFLELEEYIKSKYQAIPVALSEQRTYSLKMNIIMNRVLEQPIFRNLKDIENFDHDQPRNKARKMIEEGFELDYIVYSLNVTDLHGNPVEAILERKWEYINLNGDSRDIWNDLIIAYGVFKNDIENATMRFVGYVRALEDRDNRRKG